MFNTQKLDRNENNFHSYSFETAKALTLNSHKSNFSRLRTQSKFQNLQPKISSTCEYPPISKTKTPQNTIMNRQLSNLHPECPYCRLNAYLKSAIKEPKLPSRSTRKTSHHSIRTIARLINLDKRNKPYKLAPDVAELIKTLRITPNATTKITPFEARFGRKPNTPLSNIATSPKLSNLSWENIKLACLDQKLLTKPALTAEAMWKRDANSEDELDINYRQKQNESQLVPDNMPSSSKSTTSNKTTVATKPITPSGKRKATTQVEKPLRPDGWDSSDEEFDRQLLARFPIGAHLPLTNTTYDLIKEKRKFLNEKTGHNIEKIKTRIPIHTLTPREKQKMERAPIVFLKDRFKGPQSTINPKLGQKIDQVARKSGTIARKIKKPGVFGAQFKILENGSISKYSPHTAWVREDGKQPRVIRHDGLAFVPDPRVYGKCRPAALKYFVAYKHLPRAKPRVLAKSPKLERAKQINKQEKQEQSKSQTSPKKSQTSPRSRLQKSGTNPLTIQK